MSRSDGKQRDRCRERAVCNLILSLGVREPDLPQGIKRRGVRIFGRRVERCVEYVRYARVLPVSVKMHASAVITMDGVALILLPERVTESADSRLCLVR